MTDVLIAARDLSKRIHDGERMVTILDHVSLQVGAGETVALLGPSGSGKSTLLQVMGGLDPDFEGSVQAFGQELRGLPDPALAALRNQHMGFVFQAYNLLAHLTARENVMLPGRFAKQKPDRERANALLSQVGLADKAHRRPGALSGGERQRVAIARALYQSPRVVLCDEPTGNLDEATARDIIDLFGKLAATGLTLIIATHDPAIATWAERVVRLRGGRLA
jgi:ABC-type lipoprotein export system ATPase subunit